MLGWSRPIDKEYVSTALVVLTGAWLHNNVYIACSLTMFARTLLTISCLSQIFLFDEAEQA